MSSWSFSAYKTQELAKKKKQNKNRSEVVRKPHAQFRKGAFQTQTMKRNRVPRRNQTLPWRR
jgi:hypothetical protein